MSKKQKQPPRFRDIWMNQTELGRHFGISAVAVGKKLSVVGLRTEQKEPTELAKTASYCRFTPMKDGTPFYLWNKEKVAVLFREAGMNMLPKEEVEARATAEQLIELAEQAEATGIDKLLYFFADDIPQREYPLIDRFLRELGSDLRLGTEEAPAKPLSTGEALPSRIGGKDEGVD
jgi:hypothetical protein